MSISVIPRPNISGELRLATRDGVAAVDDGEGGRICWGSGDRIEGAVGNDGIIVGEVEEVFNDKVVTTAGLGIRNALLRPELRCRSYAEAPLEKLRCLHLILAKIRDQHKIMNFRLGGIRLLEKGEEIVEREICEDVFRERKRVRVYFRSKGTWGQLKCKNLTEKKKLKLKKKKNFKKVNKKIKLL